MRIRGLITQHIDTFLHQYKHAKHKSGFGNTIKQQNKIKSWINKEIVTHLLLRKEVPWRFGKFRVIFQRKWSRIRHVFANTNMFIWASFRKNKRSSICRSLFGFSAFYENPDRMIARERASHKNDKQSCIVSQTEETEAAYELMGSTFRGCSYYPACQGISPSATNICVHSCKGISSRLPRWIQNYFY